MLRTCEGAGHDTGAPAGHPLYAKIGTNPSFSCEYITRCPSREIVSPFAGKDRHAHGNVVGDVERPARALVQGAAPAAREGDRRRKCRARREDGVAHVERRRMAVGGADLDPGGVAHVESGAEDPSELRPPLDLRRDRGVDARVGDVRPVPVVGVRDEHVRAAGAAPGQVELELVERDAAPDRDSLREPETGRDPVDLVPDVQAPLFVDRGRRIEAVDPEDAVVPSHEVAGVEAVAEIHRPVRGDRELVHAPE